MAIGRTTVCALLATLPVITMLGAALLLRPSVFRLCPCSFVTLIGILALATLRSLGRYPSHHDISSYLGFFLTVALVPVQVIIVLEFRIVDADITAAVATDECFQL